MKVERTILTAPELDNVTILFAVFKSMDGNVAKSISDFFHFVTTPSLERDRFLLNNAKSAPIIVNNIVHNIFTS